MLKIGFKVVDATGSVVPRRTKKTNTTTPGNQVPHSEAKGSSVVARRAILFLMFPAGAVISFVSASGTSVQRCAQSKSEHTRDLYSHILMQQTFIG